MDVGYIVFHDQDQVLQFPTIYITNVTEHTKYNVYPKDWPTWREILEKTNDCLMKYYEDQLGIEPLFTSGSLTIECLPVDEPGQGVHNCTPTTV